MLWKDTAPQPSKSNADRQHHEPVIQREIYEFANHGFFLELRSRASLIVDRVLEIDRVRHDLLARLQPG